MSTIKIGIVEDEVVIADHLGGILLQLGYEVAEPAASFQEAITMIETERPDLLLIDIQLKGKKDGVELGMKIKEEYRLPFIFLTANADPATVQRAKQASPNAYLVKPFTRDDLYTSIEIALQNATAAAPAHSISAALFIKDGNYFHKVKFADILYLESEHVYVQVHTAERKFLVRTSMQQYLAQFDERQFIRIHRSYVVNLEQVQTVNAEQVMMKGIVLPVGKTYQEELLKRLGIG